MIKDIQELNFPSYATMSAATVSLPDMGEWNITSQIKIDGQIAPDFSFDWEVVHDGHKYIMPLRKPQGSKENTTLNSVIDLTFQHWAVYQLKRFPFVTMQPIDSGTAVADEEVATPSLNLGDFCSLFGMVLNYYYGDKITLQLNPDWQYKAEAEVITISHTKVWNVLIEVFYKQFGVRWQIEPNGSYDKYVIKVGYPTTEQSHIFEYGFEGGLMKVERQVQSEEICNLLKGRGGEKNLPYRYFKNVDPENDTFKADPDWIEELKTLPFNNLMPATFRSYVQGWKAAHISKYPGYTAVGEANAYAPWAYRKGFTDTKFHPVEFVADEITINPEAGDRQVEILPGYSPFVKKGSSLDKYGALMNSLDNNEEIYPTIQGVTIDPYGRIDEAVAVEPITSDDVVSSTEEDAVISNVEGCRKTIWPQLTPMEYRKVIISGTDFTIPEGKVGDLEVDVAILGVTNKDKNESIHSLVEIIEDDTVINVYDALGQKHTASGLPSGSYRYEIEVKIHNLTTNRSLVVIVGANKVNLIYASLIDNRWKNTFDIWVKNIWQTSKQSGETDAEYAERVWRPILGDRAGNEAKVVFASGMLAHEDYEFVITSIPKYERKKCTWQTVENGEVVEHEYWSEWCITLGKSDAELETLGVYLPSVMRQAKAGDFFFFIGIDMPHQYTVWNEIRIDDDWKKPILGEKKDIKPTWVVQTDRVRLNNEGKPDALIRQLHPGDTLRLADKRFIEGDHETLYLSSLTITYREPTKDDAALNPDVEIVLSDRYEVSANPVATLQGEVSALAKQVGSISNVEQIVRAVGDKLYLRKDGLPDRSMSPTEFASLLTSLGFRSGMVGGAGWGIYKDANGNWVIEADRFMARQDLEVNNLVINQVVGQGGTIVESAARMEIIKVIDLSNGYQCFFDQKNGSVANLFHVDDVAWNNRYTPENEDLKAYKRRVIEVGADYVLLSKTDVNGTGIPAEGDVIVQRGNYTDATRQYIKVRDIIGGGYERYIGNLNSVNAEGVQYHFVGRTAGELPQWFTGERDLIPYSGEGDGSYIEFANHHFNLNNVTLSVGSKIGDKTLGDIIQGIDASKYLREALSQSTIVDNGLVLTSSILLGRTNQLGERETWAGHNGLYNNPKTIASWWGGNMIDRFYDEDGNARETPLVSGFAASLVRMNGSAYFSKGNIGFEADGSGWLGNYENGIRFGMDGSMTFGSGIKIALNGTDEGLKNTLESLLNVNASLTALLEPCDAQGNRLTWIEAAQNDGSGGIKAKSLRSKVGFSSEEYISAKDVGTGTVGGGASVLSGLSDVLLTDLAAGQVLAYDGSKWINQPLAASGMDQDAVLSLLATKGYATQSWVLGKGYITASALDPYLTASDAALLYQPKGNYLTDHQSISHLLSKTDAALLYQPKGNYALASALDNYLPLTGGLLSGSLADLLRLNSTSTHCYIRYNVNGSNRASSGYYNGLAYIANEATFARIGVNDAGIPQYWPSYDGAQKYTLWHSGNDGADSGLDADMLDGVHLSGLFRVADFNEDANALSVSGAYKTVASIINTPLNANGNQLIHLNWDSNAANQLFLRYNTDAMYFRRKTGGVWHDWKQFAFTDSNVASASKLDTTATYKLWGQTFFSNGVPQSVSGDMTGVGNITFKGDIGMQGYTSNYARGFHVLGATSGTRIATICGIVGNNDLYSRIYFGGDYNAPFLCLLPTGNIAVGKTTADYKFDVAGDIHNSGDIISEGAIAAKAVKVATVFTKERGEEVEV